MDDDRTVRNYRLARFDRREGRDRRGGEERRQIGGNRLREFRARRDGVYADRRQSERRRVKRGVPHRGSLIEELRHFIIKRMVRIHLYGTRDRKIEALEREIEERRAELEALAEAPTAEHEVSRDPSTSVES
jgi:hypothetical protein